MLLKKQFIVDVKFLTSDLYLANIKLII